MTVSKRLKQLAACTALAAGLITGGSAADAADKHKIFLSMSYIGNDWQAEAANMVKAMAAHKSLADKVDLQVQVAGPNAQRQIQQINAMVQAGAEAIVVYPISPTALNQVVKNACDKGVKIFAYDGDILTDLGGAVSGGIGFAASGNLDPTGQAPSLFEPVHGSAPDIAGLAKANPIAAILSAAMMLDALGEGDAAARIRKACTATADLNASTPDIGDAIAGRV